MTGPVAEALALLARRLGGEAVPFPLAVEEANRFRRRLIVGAAVEGLLLKPWDPEGTQRVIHEALTATFAGYAPDRIPAVHVHVYPNRPGVFTVHVDDIDPWGNYPSITLVTPPPGDPADEHAQ